MFIDDLLSTIRRQSSFEEQDDEWVNITAGAYTTGKKDVLKDLFKGITK